MTLEEKKKIAAAIGESVGAVMQRASYEVGDMLNKLDSVDRSIYLAQMQCTINALRTAMDEKELWIMDFIVEHTQLTILPTAFDPRKKGGAT